MRLSGKKKATDEIYSLINDRHRAVHHTLTKNEKGSWLLDIGCGTGQLAIEADLKGYQSIGIDFAEEMIHQADINAADEKSNAKFKTASVFDFSPERKFHVISAMGFIEYISLQQLENFLEFCNQNTTENGSISIGSRNRLFNLTTFNEYTEIENKLGSINELLKEASLCISSKNKDVFIRSMRDFIGTSSLVQNSTHPLTGIEVGTRYQFTPSDLMHKIEKHGFQVTNIFPINYHAFHPSIHDEKILKIRKYIAEEISSNHLSEYRHLPNSSSFVIEAFKIA
jgi:2-polyprenyl-3-methyl-5-hydroxy-6-metoxy-1,4-benzoquinol methylase